MVEILGHVGSVFIIVAYALLISGKIKASSSPYLAFNIIGCTCTSIYAWNGAMPLLMLQATWLGVSLYGVYLYIRSK